MKIFKLLNIILIAISMFLSYLIFVNKNSSFLYLNKLYSTMTNYLNIGKKDTVVNNYLKYIKIEEHKYKNDDYSVFCPFDGTIINQTNTSIIVKCQNNVYAYFDNLINVNTSKYDVITNTDSLANFIDYFIMYFTIDEKIYSYEDVLEIN